MRFVQPSALLLLLSAALVIFVSSLVAWGSTHIVSIGSESWMVKGLYTGASFTWHKDTPGAPGATAPRPRYFSSEWLPRLDPRGWRLYLGMERQSWRLPSKRVEVVYISYPWLLGLSLLPTAAWIVLRMRRPRRRVNGKCANCEYDIRATPQRCPECGVELRPPSLIDRILALDVRWMWKHWRRGASHSAAVSDGTSEPQRTLDP